MNQESPSGFSPLLKTTGVCLISLLIVLAGIWASENKTSDKTIVLHGACLFDDKHSYTVALEKFAELVQTYYQGPEKVEFVLHKNSELGQEKDYFGYMNIGAVVDYAITSPSHGSTFSEMITVMDIPFLFRDSDHFLKAIDADVFARVATSLEERADIITLGYGGGEKRHLFGIRPLKKMEDLKDFEMRVMGSPIQSRMFAAIGATPTVISSGEVYNAIQTNVIDGAENSASAIQQYKWFEVAQDVSFTSVSIIVRPLFFSGKRFRTLPSDLQDAIRRAGKEAARFEREFEIRIDDPLMDQLEKEGKVRVHPFAERDKMLELAAPVKADYAEEIGAKDILDAINAIR